MIDSLRSQTFIISIYQHELLGCLKSDAQLCIQISGFAGSSVVIEEQRKWQGGRTHWSSWTYLLMVILLRGWFSRYY